MEFCPKCGIRLEIRTSKKGKQVSTYFFCVQCEYEKQKAADKAAFKIGKVIQHDPQQFVAVIGKEEQKFRTLPTVRIECPECGNNVAYVWQVQTRGLDESSTQFLRCTKCNYTFREYS
jgi:DNA-directed RNA polymerase subunit M